MAAGRAAAPASGRGACHSGGVSDLAGVHALIEQLCGIPDARAVRAVEVSNAQLAALAWVRESTGAYPATVSARLQEVADQLCLPGDGRDPREVLIQAAVAAVQGKERGAA
jgi:hypothetical protein